MNSSAPRICELNLITITGMIWTNSRVLSVAKFAFFEVNPIHIPNQQIAMRLATTVIPDAPTLATAIAISTPGADDAPYRCVVVFIPLIVVTVTTPLETTVVVTKFEPPEVLVKLVVLVPVVAVRMSRVHDCVASASPARFRLSSSSTGQPYIRSRARH